MSDVEILQEEVINPEEASPPQTPRPAQDKKSKNKPIFEAIVLQAYMVPQIGDFLGHLAQSSASGVEVSVSFSKKSKNGGYLVDLFAAIKDCLEVGVYSEQRMTLFLDKYKNKLFESGISFEDQELDHKYYKVDYEEEVPVPKKKALNAFYKVDEEMFDSEEEEEESGDQAVDEGQGTGWDMN